MGGVYLDQGDVTAGLAYLNSVYSALHQSAGASDLWPWSGVNLHIHGDWRDRAIEEAWSTHENAIEKLKSKWSDSSAVIIGEWGLSEQMHVRRPHGIEHMRRALASRADIMFFFTLDAFQEGENTWGLYDWNSEGPELVLAGPRQARAAYQRAIRHPQQQL
jgi:hypothetical protein